MSKSFDKTKDKAISRVKFKNLEISNDLEKRSGETEIAFLLKKEATTEEDITNRLGPTKV